MVFFVSGFSHMQDYRNNHLNNVGSECAADLLYSMKALSDTLEENRCLQRYISFKLMQSSYRHECNMVSPNRKGPTSSPKTVLVVSVLAKCYFISLN